MMKKLPTDLLLTLSLVFSVTTFSFGQIGVSLVSKPTVMNSDGTLDAPLVFTLTNIPDGLTTNTMNSRVYDNTVTTVNGGGHITGNIGTAPDLNDATPDVDNSNIKIETTLDTPDSGHFTRTYTIKKYGVPTAFPSTVCLAVRFPSFGSLTFNAISPVTGPESGGTSTNASFRLASGINFNVLSTNKFNISESIYPNPVSSVLNVSESLNTKTYKVVDMLGKTVLDVKATGSLNVSNLTQGLYFLVTDAGIAKFVKK